MVSNVLAVGLLGALALGWALLLRDRAPASWPRSLVVLVPVAAVVAVLVVLTDAATYLWRGVGPQERWLPTLLVVVAVAALLAARRGGASWVAAGWVAGGLLLVGLTTLPSGADGPHLLTDPAGRLRSCLLTEHRIPSLGGADPATAPVLALAARPAGVVDLGASSSGTLPVLPALDVRKLTTEQLPNVALFVPLGIGIAAAARRRTGWWMGLAVVGSLGVESYQAVFTGRTCSTVDVATNVLGVLLGWVVHAVALRLAGGR